MGKNVDIIFCSMHDCMSEWFESWHSSLLFAVTVGYCHLWHFFQKSKHIQYQNQRADWI